MKNYTKPEIEFKSFETEDVITTSSILGRLLNDTVNGNKGDNYGSKDVYSFD